jgi:hypothetical protein
LQHWICMFFLRKELKRWYKESRTTQEPNKERVVRYMHVERRQLLRFFFTYFLVFPKEQLDLNLQLRLLSYANLSKKDTHDISLRSIDSHGLASQQRNTYACFFPVWHQTLRSFHIWPREKTLFPCSKRQISFQTCKDRTHRPFPK